MLGHLYLLFIILRKAVDIHFADKETEVDNTSPRGHTGAKWQRWNSNNGSRDSHAHHFLPNIWLWNTQGSYKGKFTM